MNVIKKMKEKCEDENAFRFGLSPLHCRIKLMECILHIAYCINIKKWKVFSKSGDKDEMEEQKKKFRKTTVRKLDYCWIFRYKVLEPLMMEIRQDGFLVTHSWHLR